MFVPQGHFMINRYKERMVKKSHLKRAIITGASSGIGAAIAQHLDAHDFQVAILGRDKKKLNAVASELTHPPLILITDISKSSNVKKALQKIQKWTDTIDLLVNNAGRINRQSFLESNEDDWSMHFQTNLFGAFRITKGIFKLLKKAGSPHVINISSSLAQDPIAYTSIYSASKAAMNNWTRSLAMEWSEYRICVNSINPGIIYTPIHDFYEKTDKTSQVAIKRCHQISPLGRMGQAQDVVEAVDYLMKTTWVTGSVLTVDGGS